MKNSGRNAILIIVAVLIVAFIAVWAVFFMGSTGAGRNQPPVEAPKPTYTAASDAATNPLQAFILGANQPVQFYSIGQSSTTNQYVATWQSASSSAQLSSSYRKYFAANGWVLAASGNTSSSITASKGNDQINVFLLSQPNNMTQVNLSYAGQ